jgi:hypothetical protein
MQPPNCLSHTSNALRRDSASKATQLNVRGIWLSSLFLLTPRGELELRSGRRISRRPDYLQEMSIQKIIPIATEMVCIEKEGIRWV